MASDFSSALRLIETELADQADQVWVIGGSSLYEVCLYSLPLFFLESEIGHFELTKKE